MKFGIYTKAIDYVRELFEDLSFKYAHEWKKEDHSQKIIGFLPIYIDLPPTLHNPQSDDFSMLSVGEERKLMAQVQTFLMLEVDISVSCEL